MLPQFRSEQRIDWDALGRGLARVATGVLMMQLARLLSQGILSGDGLTSGFDRATQWSGLDVWCLAFGYGLQLFFDFAGYSHIAIGAAMALGFTLPENFARPFQSTTPSVFWTRWHMSLSFWIRDYVFLPLAMMRREYWWRTMLLVVSMVLFGLWHKATLLFLLWGLYQGVLLVLHRQVQQIGIQIELESAGTHLEHTLLDRNDSAHQPGMDSLPRQFPVTGARDVYGGAVSGDLFDALPQQQSLPPGSALSDGIRGGAHDCRCDESLRVG